MQGSRVLVLNILSDQLNFLILYIHAGKGSLKRVWICEETGAVVVWGTASPCPCCSRPTMDYWWTQCTVLFQVSCIFAYLVVCNNSSCWLGPQNIRTFVIAGFVQFCRCHSSLHQRSILDQLNLHSSVKSGRMSVQSLTIMYVTKTPTKTYSFGIWICGHFLLCCGNIPHSNELVNGHRLLNGIFRWT